MTLAKPPKRPRDFSQAAKMVVDIAPRGRSRTGPLRLKNKARTRPL